MSQLDTIESRLAIVERAISDLGVQLAKPAEAKRWYESIPAIDEADYGAFEEMLRLGREAMNALPDGDTRGDAP